MSRRRNHRVQKKEQPHIQKAVDLGVDRQNDIDKVIDDFECMGENIISRVRDKVAATKDPRVIYHYTNAEGLMGILERGTLRLTDVFYLNDPTELHFGIRKSIAQMKVSLEDYQNADVFRDTFINLIQDNLRDAVAVYSCSFSRDGDDLGQWRAYADDGAGFALGFNVAELWAGFDKRPFEKDTHARGHWPVDYEATDLDETLKDIWALFPLMAGDINKMGLTAKSLRYALTRMSTMFAIWSIVPSLYFKNSGYRNEQEHRIIEMFGAEHPRDRLRYRRRNYTLIPYIEFPWKTLAPKALTEIVVGPRQIDVSKRFAEDCVRAFSKDQNISIRTSTTPYR